MVFVDKGKCLTALVLSCSLAQSESLSFGILSGGSDFFSPVEQGWQKKCEDVGATCYYRQAASNTEECGCDCVRSTAVKEFIELGVDGIAFKPCTGSSAGFDEAEQAGIPIITFDSLVDDEAHTRKAASVGTDNKFLGRTMARLLNQLRPEGGTFAFVGTKTERIEGFKEVITKNNGRDDRAHWYEVERNFSLADLENDWLGQLENYALLNPTAIVTVTQSPMRHPNWTSFVDANRHRNITFIGSDGADYQLSYLNQRYVDGLIGQLPYEFGAQCLQVLYDLATNVTLTQRYFPTNLVAYNLIPLELPDLVVDQNLLGNFMYTGLVCFGIVAISALLCIAWTLKNRQLMVVRAAQPFFLIMTAGGVLILSSALVPLSFDDRGDPDTMSVTRSVGICMSIPWLAFLGFTVTFSALFSKTWRVNQMFESASSFGRLKVSERDVLAPFVFLFTCNLIVLVCWTVLDPLTYVRNFEDGTDYWNREFASSGLCRSSNVVPYIIPLALVNFGVLVIACWQAVQARDIKSEFSESKYIGFAVFSISQAFLTGIPIVAVVRDIPEAFYLLMTFLVFILCMLILLLIFLPKVFMQKSYTRQSLADQNKMMSLSVRKSLHSSGFDGHGSSSTHLVHSPSLKSVGLKKVVGGNPPVVPSTATDDTRLQASSASLSRLSKASHANLSDDAFAEESKMAESENSAAPESTDTSA